MQANLYYQSLPQISFVARQDLDDMLWPLSPWVEYDLNISSQAGGAR
jgi:hypothetical protein